MTPNRLWVVPVHATRWRGRVEFFKTAWFALLHPRPTLLLRVPGRHFEVKAASLRDVAALLRMAARHAVKGETVFVLNHNVWVPGATASDRWPDDTWDVILPPHI
jgi:hypothetical protein